MKVLIVGSGGREHAIAWSVSQSKKVDKIYCAPGNGGISQIAECVDIAAMEFDNLADFAEKNEIDLTIIGMDDPLVGGIVDVFEIVDIDHGKIVILLSIFDKKFLNFVHHKKTVRNTCQGIVFCFFSKFFFLMNHIPE